MGAPSGTQWGDIKQGSSASRQGRIGIYVSTSSSGTVTNVYVEVWFWSKYSIHDSNNNFYAAWSSGLTEGDKQGSVNIYTDVSSGGGWSASNQQRIGVYSTNYGRGTSARTGYFSASLSGIENLYISNVLVRTVSFTIPALESHTVSYNGNGGVNAPSSQTKWYGSILTLSSQVPYRNGYDFVGWGTSPTSTVASYQPSGQYGADADITLYAIWQKVAISVTLIAYETGGQVQGSDRITKSVLFGDALGELPFAERKSYKFIGWNTYKDGTGAWLTEDLTIIEPIVAYAIFKLQANCYIKQNGEYIYGMMYRRVNGVYETGTTFAKDNGEYKNATE